MRGYRRSSFVGIELHTGFGEAAEYAKEIAERFQVCTVVRRTKQPGYWEVLAPIVTAQLLGRPGEPISDGEQDEENEFMPQLSEEEFDDFTPQLSGHIGFGGGFY